jgi:hypothetical protein
MPDIKSYEAEYNCPNIKGTAETTFHYIDDRKKGLRTEGVMEDCDSTVLCGIENATGGINWDQCPIHGKKPGEINLGTN